ncbi:hypothetical protein RCH10_000762 [Variovorax sp. GrIS 2.14]|uniref:hypothetical protein n=1 Tax=Variovorax sp. GrIS 2.14 TaxID=3071709 RepID=UPI0038F63552
MLTLQGFAGAALGPNPKLLADTVGTNSINQKPGRSDLRPWKQPLAVATIPAGRKTIYRMGRSVISDTLYWLSWDTRVHLVHGLISGDATERTYYTGDGAPKQTNNTIALASAPYPTTYRDLGVPVPTSPITVVPITGGTSTEIQIRYYTYTYVTNQGEESAPAPVSALTSMKSDQTATLNSFAPPAAGSHGVNRIRVYRTESGQAGDTEFFFLREELSSITTTTDDLRALGEVMPTDGWFPPPATLSCLTSMWNGMIAGINTVDGAVRYSIPYKPYAWPIAFETLPPDARAVGLGRFGQRLLVLTTGDPVLVSGGAPEALDEQPLPIGQSCVSEPSIVSFGHGVCWACPDGLAYFGEGGPKLLTTGIFTRDDWQAMVPGSMIGAIYEGAYFGSYTVGGVTKGFFIDPLNPTGLYFFDTGYAAAYVDDLNDMLYVHEGASVKKWDAGASMTTTFRSKEFRQPLTTFAAGRVIASAFPVTVMVDAINLEPAVVAARVAARPTKFSAPDATTLRHTRSVANRKPFRLPGDFVARDWVLSVVTQNPVVAFTIATSMAELGEA